MLNVPSIVPKGTTAAACTGGRNERAQNRSAASKRGVFRATRQNNYNQGYRAVVAKIVIKNIITIKMKGVVSVLEKMWSPNKFKCIFLSTTIMIPSIAQSSSSKTSKLVWAVNYCSKATLYLTCACV